MKHSPTRLPIALLTLLCLLTTACVDEETDLGANLAGDGARYEGVDTTLYADAAYSFRDTALQTGGYYYNIIGNYSDATFGKVSAELYTQLSLPSRTSTIDFESVEIDSVVLTLVKNALYPDTNGTYSFHFEVRQLAEAVSSSDSIYTMSSTLPVGSEAPYFDQAVTVSATDTVVRLKLSNDIVEALRYTGDNDGFVAHAKGLRIRIVGESSDPGMLTIDFSATKTRLTAYYRYGERPDTSDYQFSLSHRFMHYEHDYTTAVVGDDSVPGANALYLEPLGGYSVRVSFDQALSVFRAAHPRAVIHHAELLLPLATGDYGTPPERVVAYKAVTSGTEPYIADYLLAGVDGYYHSDANQYRLRVTQHVQGLLRDGIDRGTTLVINSRRSTATRTVLCGTTTGNRVKIALTYSE